MSSSTPARPQSSSLHGEHDLEAIDQLSLALALAGGGQFILVDLRDASFLDSSAINAVLRAARQARRRGGALELVVNAAGAVRGALDAAGIPLLLPLHASRAVALASLEVAALLAGDDRAAGDLPTDDIEAEIAAVRAHLGATGRRRHPRTGLGRLGHRDTSAARCLSMGA